MDIAIVCLLAVLAVTAIAGLVAHIAGVARAAPAIDGYVGHTVVVHLRGDGPSLRGVLVAAARDALTLADAAHLVAAGPILLEGRQLVPRDRLEYFQVLARGGGV